jgi:hypothetical protein
MKKQEKGAEMPESYCTMAGWILLQCESDFAKSIEAMMIISHRQ